ncbi:hypothetical protein KVR01_003168 [Diaporthe batatas]|uniref:uncharacterized protein n=1 Tax=Diaporthe batatas TaxID=748121 RepID=UPI001D0398C4|nr:uncharacterized protein KVR01_003168 [Diaporthe batatas]KAG8167479.1 hypothetical protein KVR01_003168 [Diaporthe batatas]
MVAHLRVVHKMDLAQAKELIDREGRTETVAPGPKVLGPKPGGINNDNSNKKRRGNQQASITAPGKENDDSLAAAASGGVQGRVTGAGEHKVKKPRVKKS